MTPEPRQWLPVVPAVTNTAAERSQEAYRAVLAQFGVEHAQRYAPVTTTDALGHTAHTTFCNCFVWDATSALGCEIPHWRWADGSSAPPGGTRSHAGISAPEQATEMRANGMPTWLNGSGLERGWVRVPEGAAVEAAALGKPAVVVWVNQSGGPGHTAMVVPPAAPGGPTRVVQAGAVCGEFQLREAFGNRVVEFWVHP